MIPRTDHPGARLNHFDPDTADLVEQISQLAHAPAHAILADLFDAYTELRFACADDETSDQVRIEPDHDHGARVSAHLPDGTRLDLLHRPTSDPAPPAGSCTTPGPGTGQPYSTAHFAPTTSPRPGWHAATNAARHLPDRAKH